MPKQVLFDEDSEEEVELKTENEYAKKYDKWREKEELYKLEQKYGSKALNSDVSLSSDSEDESDEPPEVSEEVETQFLKTLALLKTKDPRIYDPNFKFFDQSEKKEHGDETKTKKLTFADSDDDDDEDDDENIFSIEKKAEIEENHPKGPKATNETKEGKLRDYLTGKAEHLGNEVEKDLAPLKALWSDPKLNEGEAFLRDYILNKCYLDEGDIGEAEGDKIRDDEDLEADEVRVEEQGKFERAYNFRFEEPDQEYLKRYPRTMNYIRPKDDRRARKREEVRVRKEEEKRKKMEEIARLKALKLKEIQEKIAKIKEVTGNEELAFKEDDLNSDFDPDEHDKRMKEIFDEQYYGDADTEKPVFPELDEELEIENWENYQPEYDGGADRGRDGDLHCEDEDFNMDADYDPKKARENLLEQLKRTQGKKRKNRKKKSKLAELLSTEKPKFVPTVAEKTYSEYMEEYYKMDCEDVIGGDLPTRFKYREVVPNDYGLAIEEILLADDKELTQWVPLKKVLKHRPSHVEKGEAKTYTQKAADVRLKRKVLPSLFQDLPDDPEIAAPVEEATKKKNKKKHKQSNQENSSSNNQLLEEITSEQLNADAIPENTETMDISNNVSNDLKSNINKIHNNDVYKKKKKKKNKESNQDDNIQKTDSLEPMEDTILENINTLKNCDIVSDNLKSGLNIKNRKSQKKKKKNNKHNNDFVIENIQNTEQSQECIHDKNKKAIENSSDNIHVEKIKKNKVKQNSNEKIGVVNVNLKRKSNADVEVPTNKKMKGNNDANTTKLSKKERKLLYKQRDKLKRKNEKQANNPFSSLSDERLKAYGLNPKKYKNFMKYKKF